MNHLTVKDAALQLAASKKEFITLMQHGSMKVECYKPHLIDKQTPHLQDELYVIYSGTGIFYNNGKRSSFSPGDVLYVPAGHEHRFETFTSDFATWVIFYGPESSA